jgi:SAM-dependent methyltransferase
MSLTDTKHEGLRLNLGSGPHVVAGWESVDRSPSQLLDHAPRLKKALRTMGWLSEAQATSWPGAVKRLDVRRLPYSPQSAAFIYSSHTLEHLYLEDAASALASWHRLLAPSGLLRLALPDAREIAAKFLAEMDDGNPQAGWNYNAALLCHPKKRPTGLELARLALAGHIHRWQPSVSMVTQMLEAAGFHDIRECAFGDGEMPDLENLEIRPESFFLEARAEVRLSIRRQSS